MSKRTIAMTNLLITGKPAGLKLLDHLSQLQKELYLRLPNKLGLEPVEWKGNLYFTCGQVSLLNSLLVLLDDKALKEFQQALEDSSGSFLYKCSKCRFLWQAQQPLCEESLKHKCNPLVLKRQLPESHLLSSDELLRMYGHFHLIASGPSDKISGLLHSLTLRSGERVSY
jgi:hypothetical protein